MRGKSHDAFIRLPRTRSVATGVVLTLLLSVGAAEAAMTMKQCYKEASVGSRRCNQLPSPGQCLGQVAIRLERCACASRGGVLSSRLGVYECTLPAAPPVSYEPPEPKPDGIRPVGTTPPKSSTPDRPRRPGTVGTTGTPPKSNPTPGVKPQGVRPFGSPPKSQSSSGGGGGGGPIVRSGHSGHSNPKSGGGNSGGRRR